MGLCPNIKLNWRNWLFVVPCFFLLFYIITAENNIWNKRQVQFFKTYIGISNVLSAELMRIIYIHIYIFFFWYFASQTVTSLFNLNLRENYLMNNARELDRGCSWCCASISTHSKTVHFFINSAVKF